MTLKVRMESATAFNASGRVNPFLQANPICLAGTGFAKDSAVSRLLWYLGVSALQGMTVMPSPEATI